MATTLSHGLVTASRSGLWWRVHDRRRPFAVDDAHSMPLSDKQMWGDQPWLGQHWKPGYSAFDDPWHLWFYVVAMGWHADKLVQGDDVLEFSGREITIEDFDRFRAEKDPRGAPPREVRDRMWDNGRGLDGEFLILPDMQTVHRMSWPEFERRLISTPLPPSPQGEVRFNSLTTWPAVVGVLAERKAKGLDTGPVVDFLLHRFSGKISSQVTAWGPRDSLSYLDYQASAPLFRGLKLPFTPSMEAMLKSRDPRLAQEILRVAEDGGDFGVGGHWTTKESIARDYAWTTGYPDHYYGVVLRGTPAPSTVITRGEADLDDEGYPQAEGLGGWVPPTQDYPRDMEVPLRPGGRITVDEVSVVAHGRSPDGLVRFPARIVTTAMPMGRPTPDLSRGVNDCQVVAVMALAGITYEQAWAEMVEAGWSPNVPPTLAALFRVLSRHGRAKLTVSVDSDRTVSQFLSEQPGWTGAVVAQFPGRGHVIPVVDGEPINDRGFLGATVTETISFRKLIKTAMPMGRPYLHTNHDTLRTIVPDFPEDFDQRVPGDCGPVAVAALTGLTYAQAVQECTQAGFTPGQGMSIKEAISVIQRHRSTGRFTRQYVGTTLRSYLSARPDWTGLVLVKTDEAHLIPVIKGWVFNGMHDKGTYDDADVIATITVTDWQKVQASYEGVDGDWHLSPDDRAVQLGYWYHGSPSKFPPGTILTGVAPRRGTPAWSETYANDPERANWVWVTDSVDEALEWGAKQGWIDEDKVHVYRVQPLDGPVRPYDPQNRSEGWVVPRARVLTEVEVYPRGLPKGEMDPFVASVDDYGISHRPNEDGPPAYDLLAEVEGGEWGAPPDIYDHPEWYLGDPSSTSGRETIRAIRQARGKPDGQVTIYRSAPKGEFNRGDWVSLSKDYARESGLHPTDEGQDLPVWSVTVPAKFVRWAGDDLNEWGYWGPDIKGLTKRAEVISTSASLSLEDIISVAEQVMERRGLAGRTITVPSGREDDPEYQAAIAPLREWCRSVMSDAGAEGAFYSLYTSDYTLRREGNPLAMVTAIGSVVVRPVTNEMTILHELAHLATRTRESSGGHTPEFARTVRRMYDRWISPEAGAAFWDLVSPSLRSTAMAAGPVVHLGRPKLKYDYYGTPERIGILDPDAPPALRGHTYFTDTPQETSRSRVRRDLWDQGKGTTKTKPKAQYEDGSGTADPGTVAFLDFYDRPDTLFIAYMSTRPDQRGQGYARQLVDWVYAEARRRGKSVVDWGTVFYPANILYWEYHDRPQAGVSTAGHPLDGRQGSLVTAAVPDFKGTDRNLSDRQVMAACQRLLKDIAREFGWKGDLPEIQVEPALDSTGRYMDPTKEYPYGCILLSPDWLDDAKAKDYGVQQFRIFAHEAIHALVQVGHSYQGIQQVITEGAAEVLSMWYWAKNAPAFDEREQIKVNRGTDSWPKYVKTLPGTDSMIAQMNYREWVDELLRRAGSKVGWDQERIIAEIKRVSQGDGYARIDFGRTTDAHFPGPGTDAEGLMRWLLTPR